MNRVFDVIVVGSGAGGAAVAHELARRGKETLVLEAGPDIRAASLGRMLPATVSPGYYNRLAIFSRSVDGSIIYHTSNLGGSTVFACGNMIRSRKIEDAFSRDFAMDGLSFCFGEAEREASVDALPISWMSEGAKVLLAASLRLGLDAKPAAKGGVPGRTCRACGKCVFGCNHGAKWDSRLYLSSLPGKGGEVRTETRVEKVLFEGKRATGVEVTGRGRGRAAYKRSIRHTRSWSNRHPEVIAESRY